MTSRDPLENKAQQELFAAITRKLHSEAAQYLPSLSPPYLTF